MKKTEPIKISKQAIIESLRLECGDEFYRSFIEKDIASTILPQVLGDVVCSYFTEVKNRDGVMIVKVSSAPLKLNLVLQKSNIIEKINKEIGIKFVDNIVFL
ncbi:hypothetical protein HW49_06965 [Porphyromonadaceae bacterium COT-184 OH4590]|nr:hypothetical protein HW49_06965 [Porphyromonadaceae bacterium COT-184 OH4590]MDO4725962.1 DUF721 domain-containing protein [Porphyromonadaceae bacterium]